MPPCRKDVDEGLAGVALLEQGLEVPVASEGEGVQGRVNPPDHGGQVGHEGEAHRPSGRPLQPLTDLRQVPVPGNGVGLQALARLAQERAHGGLAPGSADTGFRVGDQTVEVHQAPLDERQETQLDRRGVAAGVGHQARPADGVAVDLRQAIHRLLEEVLGTVRRAVPALPKRGVPQTEVGRQVDHPHTGVQEPPRHSHRRAVRRGEEHDPAGREGVRVRGREDEVGPAPQAREQVGNRRSGLTARGDDPELHLGVTHQETQQLDPRVAGTAHHSHPDHRAPSLPIEARAGRG